MLLSARTRRSCTQMTLTACRSSLLLLELLLLLLLLLLLRLRLRRVMLLRLLLLLLLLLLVCWSAATEDRTVQATAAVEGWPGGEVRYTRVVVARLAGVHALSGALLLLLESLLLAFRSCSVGGEILGLLPR